MIWSDLFGNMRDQEFIDLKSFHGGYTTDVSHLRHLGEQDETAWNQFYDKYRAMIFSVGAKRGLSNLECEDLMQEVAIICSRKLQNFIYEPDHCRFRSFLFRITQNIAWNIGRKKPAAIEKIDADDYGIPELDIKFMKEYEKFLLERSFQILEASVDSETFMTFDMLVRQELPVKDVVMRTGKSANTIYAIKHRCMKKLQCIINGLTSRLETPPETGTPAE